MNRSEANRGLISADVHVVEPPEFWQQRVPKEFRDQVPRLVHGKDRDEWWTGESGPRPVSGAGNQAGHRVEHSTERQYGGENPVSKSFGSLSVDEWDKVAEEVKRWEDIRPGGYNPDEMLKDLELDGVYAGIIYPTSVLTYYRRPTSPLVKAIFTAYNDWMGEFCSVDSNRLKCTGLVLLDDINESIKEMERCRGMGLGSVMIPAYPEPHLPYSDPVYEPFWDAVEDLGMPLTMHIQAWRCQPEAGQLGEMAFQHPEVAEFIGDKTGSLFGREPVDMFCTTDYYIRRSTGELIFSGVFERHPKIKLVLVEFDTAFVPYHLSRMDHTYFEYPQVAHRDKGGHQIPFPSGLIPSDFWYRHIAVTFQEDPLGLQRLRDIIGVENMMWGNDYPHRESTWPRSLERIEETFKGVPVAEKELITRGNAAKLWNIT